MECEHTILVFNLFMPVIGPM